jgi:hypothetical protein
MFKAMMRWEWARMTQPRVLGFAFMWAFVTSLMFVGPSHDSSFFYAVVVGPFAYDGYIPNSDLAYFRSRPLPDTLMIFCKILSSSLAIIAICVLVLPMHALWALATGLPWGERGASFAARLLSSAPHLDLEYLRISWHFFVFAFLGLSYKPLPIVRNRIFHWKTAAALAPTAVVLALLIANWKFSLWELPTNACSLALGVSNVVVGMLLARTPMASETLSQTRQVFNQFIPVVLAFFLISLNPMPVRPRATAHGTAELNEQVLDLYSVRTAPAKALKIRQQVLDERTLLFASNGTSLDVQLTLRFTVMKNTEASKPVPLMRTIPAGEEVYLLSVKAKEAGKPWKFKYEYEQ